MWYQFAQQNNLEPLNKNNPQDLSVGNKIITIAVKTQIQQLAPNSPPQILEDDQGQKLVLVHGLFADGKMYYTLDNQKSGGVDDFKKWLQMHGLAENTPYLACDGGQVIFDPNKGSLNPLLKNPFPISVGEIKDPATGQQYITIEKAP